MIEIQEMTAADVADIAALERLCFSAPWSENSIAEELETGFSLWLVARLLGMPYPGGAALDRAAQGGDPSRYPMPRPHLSGNPLDLSFSGLKTSAVNLIHNAGQKGEQIVIPDLCAAFSEAVCGMLVPRAMLALEQTGRKTLAVAGGVAANSRIRAALQRETAARGVRLCMPPLSLCGDNGAMIGAQAYYEYLAGNIADQTLNAYATRSMEGEAL